MVQPFVENAIWHGLRDKVVKRSSQFLFRYLKPLILNALLKITEQAENNAQ